MQVFLGAYLPLYLNNIKPIFHFATLFARRETKTRFRQRDWSKLAGEKIRREQVAKWKIGFGLLTGLVCLGSLPRALVS